QEVERGKQRRQEDMELFQTLHRMRAAGLKVSEIAKELGLNRRRLDRWLRLDALPERNRMQPRPGMPEAFREYLRQRWEAGCRHGRTLFAEVRNRDYAGCFCRLAAFLSPWRQPGGRGCIAMGAVEAAVTERWSDSPVERHVNRLKT